MHQLLQLSREIRNYMEEPRSISGGEPTDRTTGKLPTENSGSNTNQAATNGNQQSQGPVIDNNLQLVVIEGFQVGRGVARVDPNDMARLGCQPGDIVMITGSRTTAAKLVPSAIVDRGQQTIQMDSQVRQNSSSGLGERVTVRKAKVSTAEKITLLPLSGGAPIQESDLQYIARYWWVSLVSLGVYLAWVHRGRRRANF